MTQKVLKASYEGITKIKPIELKSYVIIDGTNVYRVFSRIDFLRALGRTGKAKGGRKYDQEFNLPVFLTAKNLKLFIDNDLMENSKPIIFKDLRGNESIGYKAELLPAVCNVFLDLAEKGEPQKSQEHIIERCKLLIRGFATIGIIALVDEATGYQDYRDRVALQKLLEKFIEKDYHKWSLMFPLEFYRHIFRLNNWQFDPSTVKRPSVIGKYTNDIVYKRLAPRVLRTLQEKNPPTEKGYRKQRHHQWLTGDIGIPALREHLGGILALMRISNSWRQFKGLVERAYTKYGDTYQIPYDEDKN